MTPGNPGSPTSGAGAAVGTRPGPQHGRTVLQAGPGLAQATAVIVLLHGRGAGAADILDLARVLEAPGFAYLAPEAAQRTWYPQSFLAPVAANEPWLSAALSAVNGLIAQVTAAGIPAERIMLLGFSQGACLALEYAARNAQRYGGLVGLSGGLIGPQITRGSYQGSLAGTPVFLGCSDVDPHIPAARVHETAEVLRDLDGAVTIRLYPQMAHTVNDDEVTVVRAMMRALTAQSP